MAINDSTVWEVRTTGDALNGGGFANLSPGTSVDYSQQDAAQLSLSDIASNGAGTEITSATGGFTAAMIGNTVHIPATGTFTVGWYQIISYTDTNTIGIDRSAGASKSGGTINVGGAKDLDSTVDRDWADNMADYNIIWWKAGTYYFGEAFTFNFQGRILGYKTTRGDSPTGTDRPVWVLDDFDIDPGTGARNENIIYDIRGTGGGSGGGSLDPQSASHFYNCKFYDSTGLNGTTYSSVGTGNCVFVGCEIMAAAHLATIYLLYCGSNSHFINCYIHGSDQNNSTGIYGIPATFVGCIFDSLGKGVNSSTSASQVSNCLFYNCGVALETGSYVGQSMVNCNFLGNGIGIKNTNVTPNYTNYTSHCCFYNNVIDFDNGEIDSSDITVDPLLTDPAAKDFTLGAGSPCFDSGISLGANVGL